MECSQRSPEMVNVAVQPRVPGIAFAIPIGSEPLKGVLPTDSNSGYSFLAWHDSSQCSKHLQSDWALAGMGHS